MSPIDFAAAFYIKLGRGGKYENDSIETGKLRFGWQECSVDDINAGNWNVIKKQLQSGLQGKPPRVVTSDLNALRKIVDSGPGDIWITFHKNKLWWARLASGPVIQDNISRFRRTAEPWRDHAADGRLLVINALPGKISQLQGFRATVCRVILHAANNDTESNIWKLWVRRESMSFL